MSNHLSLQRSSVARPVAAKVPREAQCALERLDPRLLRDLGLAPRRTIIRPVRLPRVLRSRRRRPGGGPGSSGLMGWLRRAWWRWHSRQQIASLDARLLKDIGISYAEAELEANKPFWRP